MKRVSEIMTRDVCLVTPEQTIAEAAALMRDNDVGSVAVHEGDALSNVTSAGEAGSSGTLLDSVARPH